MQMPSAMSFTEVALVAASFLLGYGTKLWQDSSSMWRCDFVYKYTFKNGGWDNARCEYPYGHPGPHRTRTRDNPPDHHNQNDEKKEGEKNDDDTLA